MNQTMEQIQFEDGSVKWVPATPVPYFQKPGVFERIFGVVSRKKIIAQAVRLYLNNDIGCGREKTPELRVRNLYYQKGNCNALNALCSSLGIDLAACIKRDRHWVR